MKFINIYTKIQITPFIYIWCIGSDSTNEGNISLRVKIKQNRSVKIELRTMNG